MYTILYAVMKTNASTETWTACAVGLVFICLLTASKSVYIRGPKSPHSASPSYCRLGTILVQESSPPANQVLFSCAAHKVTSQQCIFCPECPYPAIRHAVSQFLLMFFNEVVSTILSSVIIESFCYCGDCYLQRSFLFATS